MMKVSEIVDKLNLQSHPDGGFYVETMRDNSITLSKSLLPPQCIFYTSLFLMLYHLLYVYLIIYHSWFYSSQFLLITHGYDFVGLMTPQQWHRPSWPTPLIRANPPDPRPQRSKISLSLITPMVAVAASTARVAGMVVEAIITEARRIRANSSRPCLPHPPNSGPAHSHY
ncbi:hypothetical protein BVRB_8g190840 [Beta vulgaris subsp. vulgaris]|nr:hypothetical protein BVRB_8g190840 [Beta vulgaris subsp. vulgaris]